MFKIKSNEMKILSTIGGFVAVGFGVYQTIFSIFQILTQTEFGSLFATSLGHLFFGLVLISVGSYFLRRVNSDFINYYQTEILSGVIFVFATVFGYYLSGMMSNVNYFDLLFSIFGLGKGLYIGIPEYVLIAMVVDALVVLGSAAILVFSYLSKLKNV
jgi:hypothetical protein